MRDFLSVIFAGVGFREREWPRLSLFFFWDEIAGGLVEGFWGFCRDGESVL